MPDPHVTHGTYSVWVGLQLSQARVGCLQSQGVAPGEGHSIKCKIGMLIRTDLCLPTKMTGPNFKPKKMTGPKFQDENFFLMHFPVLEIPSYECV